MVYLIIQVGIFRYHFVVLYYFLHTIIILIIFYIHSLILIFTILISLTFRSLIFSLFLMINLVPKIFPLIFPKFLNIQNLLRYILKPILKNLPLTNHLPIKSINIFSLINHFHYKFCL